MGGYVVTRFTQNLMLFINLMQQPSFSALGTCWVKDGDISNTKAYFDD
jgi:hypothetical protein